MENKMYSNYDINKLYQEYLDILKPLIATIEGKYEIFPEGILNEIRALYDHIARLSILEMSEDIKNEEFKKAIRHIHRAKLDCYKILCTMGEISIEQFEKNYKNVRLGEVDSGKFLPKYEELKNIARNKTFKAKIEEKNITSNEENVSILYQKAISAFENLENFIKSNYENLAWSVSNQKLYTKKGYIIAFILGVIATIIGTIICKCFNIL